MSEVKEISNEPLPKIEERFKEFPLIQAPKDEQGFIQSFLVEDIEGIKTFFNEYGFVVVDGILSEEEIREVTFRRKL